MGWQLVLVIALTFGALILLVLEKASLDAIGLGILLVLVGSGVISMEEGLGGFANYAVVTIAALYVLGEGLTRTGALEFLGRWVLKRSGGREGPLIFLTGIIAAVVSAFINNTAVLVVMIPMMISLARQTGIPSSRLLMPLSFAAILGGMCTLVGTSTNLLVSGVAQQHGQDPIGMFEMTAVGVPLTIAGILFMSVFARRILPVRQSLTSMMAGTSAREYVTEVLIGPQSTLLGSTYKEAFGKNQADVLFFVRDEEMFWPQSFDQAIQVGDAVMIRGGVDDLADLQSKLGLRMVGDIKFDPRNMQFFELAVAPRSAMVGRPIGNLHLWRDFKVVLVAVLRAGQHIQSRVSDLVLRPGDLLLACGEESAQVSLQASSDFYLMTGAQKQVVLRRYAKRAMLIAGLVVTLFSVGSILRLKEIPIPMAAILGAIAMVACGCVSARRAYRAIDWPILMFVVGMLALGQAMDDYHTGAGEFFAKGIVTSLEGFGPAAVISGLVLICIVFNALISHSAVAVLLTPIALAAAELMSAADAFDPSPERRAIITRAFILAIAFGGSICFATPIGHQTNLMVYGPGGYKYSDFPRLGIWMSIIAWVAVSIGIPLMTGL